MKNVKKTHRLTLLATTMILAGGVTNVQATVWATPLPGGALTSGEARFDDWGYSHVAPDGTVRYANDFAPINGFNGATQIQRVVTLGPDRLTPDAPQLIAEDFTTTKLFYDANMDSQTNFYNWGYTTTYGSEFNNMQIDADGDYHIERNDMAFAFYDVFDYQYEGTGDPTALPLGTADGVYNTNISFQPYALSNAAGWCGSTMASNPGSLEAMAGQVTFDFGFEAYFTEDNAPGTGAMQIVEDFIMRSYGTLEIDVTYDDGTNLSFKASAVVNNTNPLDGTASLDANGDPILIEVPVLNDDGTSALDANGDPRTQWVPDNSVGGGGVDGGYYNKVSFMGGGIVPDGNWLLLHDSTPIDYDSNGDPIYNVSNDNIAAVVDAGTADAIYYENSFKGYPFLLRADGIRIMTDLNYDLYSDLSNVPEVNAEGLVVNYDDTGAIVVVQNLATVPVPAAVWLFGSGLLGLVGVTRRKRTS